MTTRLDDALLVTPRWSVHRRVRASMTTRLGGASRPPYGAADGVGGGLNLGAGVGDDPADVVENRARLAACLPAMPRWLRQVHGVHVVDAATIDAPAEADAAYADRPGIVCAVLVADCAPVLFAADDGSRVAAAHAGWRGLAHGVLESTLAAGGFVSARTTAWIGPCIGPTRFEVGDDVRDAFVSRDAGAMHAFASQAAGKWLADLPALAERRLRLAGVATVHRSGHCTVLEPARFYSYRRDGVTGRMAATIWLDH